LSISSPANLRIASHDSQKETVRNSARPSLILLKTCTPRLPSIARYSFTPVAFKYSRYASAFDSGVTPCQNLTIISSSPYRNYTIEFRKKRKLVPCLGDREQLHFTRFATRKI